MINFYDVSRKESDCVSFHCLMGKDSENVSRLCEELYEMQHLYFKHPINMSHAEIKSAAEKTGVNFSHFILKWEQEHPDTMAEHANLKKEMQEKKATRIALLCKLAKSHDLSIRWLAKSGLDDKFLFVKNNQILGMLTVY